MQPKVYYYHLAAVVDMVNSDWVSMNSDPIYVSGIGFKSMSGFGIKLCHIGS